MPSIIPRFARQGIQNPIPPEPIRLTIANAKYDEKEMSLTVLWNEDDGAQLGCAAEIESISAWSGKTKHVYKVSTVSCCTAGKTCLN